MTGDIAVINVAEHGCPSVSYTSSTRARHGQGEKVYGGGWRSCIQCMRCRACLRTGVT